MAAITSGEPLLKAFWAGVQWGVGHSTGLVVVCSIFLSLKAGAVDLERMSEACNWIVGVLMILLVRKPVIPAKLYSVKRFGAFDARRCRLSHEAFTRFVYLISRAPRPPDTSGLLHDD